MQRSSRKPWLIGISLAFCFVAVVLAWLDAPRRHGEAHRQVQTLVDIQNYTAALTAYSNVFNSFPIGDNSLVTRVLAGDNPQNFQFLWLSPQKTNTAGEFLDPTHKPYQIAVTTNGIHISRRLK
jgi:hypothetical protein